MAYNGFASKPPAGTPINWQHPRTHGLVGAWDLNEGGGLAVRDATGRYGNGSFQNTPTWKYVNGRQVVDMASASSQYILIPDNPSVSLGNPSAIGGAVANCCVSLRFRMNSLRNYNALITKQSGSGQTGLFDAYVDSGGTLNTGIATNVTGLVGDKWYTFHISFDEGLPINPGLFTRVRVYIDGVLRATGTSNNTLPGTNPFRIGTRGDAVTKLDGQVESARLWNRALTPSEIKQDSERPWEIYRQRTIISTFAPSSSYEDAFTVSCSIAAAPAGSTNAPVSMSAGIVVETLCSLGGVNAAVAVTFGAILEASMPTNAAIVDAFTIAQQFDVAILASAGYFNSFGISAVFETEIAFLKDVAVDVALGLVAGIALSTNVDFTAALALGITIGQANTSSIDYTASIEIDATLETAGESGWGAAFTFGTVHEVQPIETQLAAAGLVGLGIQVAIPFVPMVSAANALGMGVIIDPQIRSNVNAQSAVGLGIVLDALTVGALLYADAFSLDFTAATVLVAGLRGVGSLSLGIHAGVDMTTVRHLSDAIAIHASLATTYGTRLDAQALVAAGVVIGASIIGGRQFADAFSVALGVNVATLPALAHGGPGIFITDAGGTPLIFRPGSGGTPGIFRPEDPGTPGIFKPTQS